MFDINKRKESQTFLDLVDDWEDPFPKPIIQEHEGFLVVRDDLFLYGSKARFGDFLVKNAKQEELIYGGAPKQGWAPISISYLAKKYNKKAKFFIAVTKNYHENQKITMKLGGEFVGVTGNLMSICIGAAKKYVARDPDNRLFLPLGLDHPTVIGSIIKVARQLNVNPKRIFTVAGTGTISRGLQYAFPDAEVHALQVGHKLKPSEYYTATVHQSSYMFSENVIESELPPYPSVRNYDAKIWKIAKQFGEPGDLIWNVASDKNEKDYLFC